MLARRNTHNNTLHASQPAQPRFSMPAAHLASAAVQPAAGNDHSTRQCRVRVRPSYRVVLPRRLAMPGGRMCSCTPRLRKGPREAGGARRW